MRLVAATLMLIAVLIVAGCEPADSLEDVQGSSSSDVFAVGPYETIVHYDGHTWSPMTGWSTAEK